MYFYSSSDLREKQAPAKKLKTNFRAVKLEEREIPRDSRQTNHRRKDVLINGNQDLSKGNKVIITCSVKKNYLESGRL